MRSRLPFAIPLAVILGGLSLLHAYRALGGRRGSAYTVPTVNGRRLFDPTPLATWAVCGLLGIGVVLVRERPGGSERARFPCSSTLVFGRSAWSSCCGRLGICGRSVSSRP